MLDCLHLLIVDGTRGEALATWHGRRWLLPVLCVDERARSARPVLSWLTEHGLSGRLVGQWLGRAAAALDASDWLTVVSARTGTPTISPSGPRWAPLRLLTRSTALLDYQGWAVAGATEAGELPRVPGPFGTTTWVEDVTAWATGVIGCGTNDSMSAEPHRASAYEAVLELRRAGGRYFFKGLSSDRASEAALTSTLADMMPDTFPRTLALATLRDGTIWWLMDACPGSPLRADAPIGLAARVVRACARVQQQIQRRVRPAPTDQLAAALPRLDLSRLAVWGTELLEATSDGDDVSARCAAIVDACERVRRSGLPESWVAADLAPGNVLVDGDHVRFIDLDDSLLGPAPLAISTFASRLRDASHGSADDSRRAALYRAYEEAWRPPLWLDDAWSSIEVVSTLVECELSWKRVLAKTERGEVHDLLDLARARLAKRLHRSLVRQLRSA